MAEKCGIIFFSCRDAVMCLRLQSCRDVFNIRVSMHMTKDRATVDWSEQSMDMDSRLFSAGS